MENKTNRRQFLQSVGRLSLVGTAFMASSQMKSFAKQSNPYINGWQAISTSQLFNTWHRGQPLKLSLTDVRNTSGAPGVRFAYQKPGQAWTMSVMSGSSMAALAVTYGQVIERSWLGDIAGWAGDFFKKAKDALKKAVKRVVGFVEQVVEDTLLGLVKKFLSKADGVLSDWINKVSDTAGLDTAALILITIIRTQGGPRQKLIAAMEAYLAEQVADAAVAAIYANP